MKRSEEVMEILEAFDLCQSYRAAAELAGVDHKTVKYWVEHRQDGRSIEHPSREKMIDPYLPKVEELVERSRGKIRADVVHRKLVAMGYRGSERTTRRAVHEAKVAYNKGHRRIYRPWVPEPAMWLQWDWGDGPEIGGRKTSLWCAWLAWSRFRVVIPTWDRTLPSVIACFDETLRVFGGAPSYALTDNEKTVTTDRVAQIAVRHPLIVATGRHYGIQIRTCVAGDPESKGGVEATVKIAKADVVPSEVNLRPQYDSFEGLEHACREFMDRVNSRVHRETGRAPAEMLIEEKLRLHPVASEPYTAAFGETRAVDPDDSTIRFHSARYSVPSHLAGEKVWVSVHGEELVLVHVNGKGANEVARHKLTTPGSPRIDDAHYPERKNDPLNPKPKAVNQAEREFLAIGSGAEQWLIQAAAIGTERVRSKMVRAVELASLFGAEIVGEALGRAAEAGRFADGDLESIVEHRRIEDEVIGVFAATLADDNSMQPGTKAWEKVGR